MITLTLLMELLGMPPDLANGTNRVGIMAQAIPATAIFARQGELRLSRDKYVIIWSMLGAIAGVSMVLLVSNEIFRSVYSYLLIILFIVVLARPKRWLSSKEVVHQRHPAIRAALYFVLGVYGGFIQMGMGVFCLVVFVLIEGRKIMQANALKILIIGLYTAVVVGVFHWKGLINWRVGLLMAIGQALGGTVAPWLAGRLKNVDHFAYYLLVLMMVIAIIKVFNVF